MPKSDFARRYDLLRRLGHGRGAAAAIAGDLGRRLPDPFRTSNPHSQGDTIMATPARSDATPTPTHDTQDADQSEAVAVATSPGAQGGGDASPVASDPGRPVMATAPRYEARADRFDHDPSVEFQRADPADSTDHGGEFQRAIPSSMANGTAVMDIEDRETGERVHLEATPDGDGAMMVTASGEPGPLMDATHEAMREVAQERNGGDVDGGPEALATSGDFEPDPTTGDGMDGYQRRDHQPDDVAEADAGPTTEALPGFAWTEQPADPEPRPEAMGSPTDPEAGESPERADPNYFEALPGFGAIVEPDAAPEPARAGATSSQDGAQRATGSPRRNGDRGQWQFRTGDDADVDAGSGGSGRRGNRTGTAKGDGSRFALREGEALAPPSGKSRPPADDGMLRSQRRPRSGRRKPAEQQAGEVNITLTMDDSIR